MNRQEGVDSLSENARYEKWLQRLGVFPTANRLWAGLTGLAIILLYFNRQGGASIAFMLAGLAFIRSFRLRGHSAESHLRKTTEECRPLIKKVLLDLLAGLSIIALGCAFAVVLGVLAFGPRYLVFLWIAVLIAIPCAIMVQSHLLHYPIRGPYAILSIFIILVGATILSVWCFFPVSLRQSEGFSFAFGFCVVTVFMLIVQVFMGFLFRQA